MADTEGKQLFQTTREGPATEEDAVAMGKDAGAQLKREAGADFFNW